jgi:hypothetical protein
VIALYAVIAVAFAVTVGIAVADYHRAELYSQALTEAKAENERLRDRFMAYSLSEYRLGQQPNGSDPIMLPEAPYSTFDSDPFGLYVEPTPDPE